MSITRYWFNSATTAEVAVPVSPVWTGTTGVRQKTLTSIRPAAAEISALGGSTAQVAGPGLLAQFIGPALPAGALSGSVVVVAAFTETFASTNAYFRLILRVVSSDGATVRGVLVDATGPTEFATTRSSRRVAGPLTPVTAQAGDRLVVEIGASNAASPGVTFLGGSYTAHPDLPDGEGFTGDGLPWVDLTLDDPIVPPSGLGQEESTETTSTIAWTAPSTGAPVTSYRVRVDEGAPIDVGLSLSYTFSGLSPDTVYTFGVQSVSATGESEWVSITGSTKPAVQPEPEPPYSYSGACFAPIRGSAIRATALDNRGAVPETIQYVTSKSVIKVLVNEVAEPAKNEILSNPEDERRLRFHKSAQTIRHMVDIEFLRVDPGFLSLVAGVELVYRNGTEGFGEEPFGMALVGGTPGDVIGFDSGTRLAPKSFALEVWSKLAGSVCETQSSVRPGAGFDEAPFGDGPFGESPTDTETVVKRQWGYTLFPHLRGGVLSGFRFDGGLVSFSLRGAQTRKASQWGVGPHDLEGSYERLVDPVSRNLSWRMFVTTGAPPIEADGIQETTDVLDNGTATNPMPDPDAALAVDAGGAITTAYIIDGGRA